MTDTQQDNQSPNATLLQTAQQAKQAADSQDTLVKELTAMADVLQEEVKNTE